MVVRFKPRVGRVEPRVVRFEPRVVKLSSDQQTVSNRYSNEDKSSEWEVS